MYKVFTISAPRFIKGPMPQAIPFVGVVTGIDLSEAASKVVEELQGRGYYGVYLSHDFAVNYSVIISGKDETPDYQYGAELKLVDTGEVSPAEIPAIIWDYNDLKPIIGWPDELTVRIFTCPDPALRQRLKQWLGREEEIIPPPFCL